MSATPHRTRARMVTAGHGDMRLGVEDQIDERAYKEGQRLVVLDADAFDALLAVAKATDQSRNFTRMFNADMTEALDALSAAHPDWRTWT